MASFRGSWGWPCALLLLLLGESAASPMDEPIANGATTLPSLGPDASRPEHKVVRGSAEGDGVADATEAKAQYESQRSNAHQRHLGRLAQRDADRDEKAYGPTYVDYEHEYYPVANYDFDDKYNTITENQNIHGYGGVSSGPWQATQDSGYPAPSIFADPYRNSPSVPLSSGSQTGCHCPSTPHREVRCESLTSRFLDLAASLGRTLWALVQLSVSSSIPFLVPLVAIKAILVPLKIFKFLALLKIMIKLFVVLPLVSRLLAPALSQIPLPNVIQAIQDMLPSTGHKQHPHLPHRDEARAEKLAGVDNDSSSTLGKEEEDGKNGNKDPWDLGACPSRIACEVAVYLSGSMYDRFSRNLVDFVARKARLGARDGTDNEETEEDDELAAKVFFVALKKRWTQDQCGVYRCWVLY
ncbi:uncharacterized protein LOC106637050 [Copidosoma floridanum]|uniref:uncharacterized protein LOC106637050 n=1 Tax=Copidosoma floridanum TaxID=29053 RepID=UPI0006C9C1AC|nr:uncharacterized protein LOC106637050 [Copidosoma floridanum]